MGSKYVYEKTSNCDISQKNQQKTETIKGVIIMSPRIIIKQHIYHFIGLSILGLLMAACGPVAGNQRFRPVLAPQLNAPQADVSGIKVWANTAPFINAPMDLESWLIPIGLDIDNTSDDNIEFSLDDIRLIDDQNQQTAAFFVPSVIYNPINVDRLKKDMKANPPIVSDIHGSVDGHPTSVFLGNPKRALASSNNQWYDETGLPTPPSTTWSEKVRFVGAPKIVALNALYDRIINKHERLNGFLFFPRALSTVQKLTFVWTLKKKQQNIKIEFVVDVGATNPN